MRESGIVAGFVSFDFPTGYVRRDVGVRSFSSGAMLATLFDSRNIRLTAGMETKGASASNLFGDSSRIASIDDLELGLRAMEREGADCVVIEISHWVRIPLVVEFVRRLGLPVALYARMSEGLNGLPTLLAVRGSLIEAPKSRCEKLVESFLEGDEDALMRWIVGVGALAKLRKSRLLCWGGGYGAEMPYTRGDPATLEGRFVAEVAYEQEVVLIEKARSILADFPGRVARFCDWLSSSGTSLRFDDRMITKEILDFQIALYLAARDRLSEPDCDRIASVSIKCHYEMSLAPLGCTACLLPAFLPFAEDAEGKRRVVPVACEGDLYGSASLAMMHALNPGAPPLFGDIVMIKNDHILMRNCGASSVYWAARSADIKECLAATRIAPNIHGRSGCAVGFETPSGGPVTFARLFRLDGKLTCFMGEAEVLDEQEGSRYRDPWPHTRLSFGSSRGLFFRSLPCNHGAICEGSRAGEAEILCRHAGIPVVRCDRDGDMERFLKERQEGLVSI